MALLNFAKTYDEVKSYINLTESNSGDYVKLIFTKDGHIITHGHDYTKDYNNGQRGLVPNYNTELGNYGILTKSGWSTLTTSFLPMGDEGAAIDKLWSSNKIVNYVQTYFSNAIKANDAMLFKGVLSSTETGDGVYEDVPSSEYHAGWTYRVKTAGQYAGGQTCEEGDIVIAVIDATSTQTTIVPGHWQVIQTNIKGKKNASINNNLFFDFYTDSTITKEIEIYAPTESGSENQVLISKGDSTPEWIDQSRINAGLLGGVSKDNLLSTVTAVDGTISVTVGGNAKSTKASGNWNINAASADKLNNAFKVTGSGLKNATYDGSSEGEIFLLPATKTTLGGVKIGGGIQVDADGVISLTKNDLETILGKEIDSIASNVIVSTETQGLAPKIESATRMVGVDYYFLAYDPNNANKKEATWYTLPSNSLGNTWRPISINGTVLFNDENVSTNALNLVNGNLITITKDTNSNNVIISTSAEVNQNAFSTIKVGTTNLTAKSKTATVTFIGTNVTIEGNSVNNTINFSVADFAGATATTAGQKGLTPAPAVNDHLKFLRGDGKWATPTDTNTWRKIIVGSNNLGNEITTGDLTITGSNNISVTLTNNTLNIASTYTPHIYTSGTGISKTTANNTTTFILKTASDTELGGIKTGYSTDAANRKYAVQLDGDSKAFVEVPWTDTNIRDIKIGSRSIGSATLNIVPSSDVVISWDQNDSDFNDGEATISFGLSWYNINTKEYETA